VTRKNCWLAFAIALELSALAALPIFSNLGFPHSPAVFVGIFLISGGAYLFAVHHFCAVPKDWQPLLLWSLAILLRLAVLPAAPGDDFWRYFWEGKIQVLGFNPYLFSPDSPTFASLRDSIWAKVNHRDFAAIYPPGAELVFSALSRVGANPFFAKTVFAAADLGVVALLLRLVNGDFTRAIWYAWNPAVIYSFAGAGHFDSLMILTLLGAVVVSKKMETSWWATLGSSILLGISISIKIIPVFLIFLWMWRSGRRWVATIPALLLPYCLTLFYGGFSTVIQPLKQFAYVARFNDLVWWIVETSIWPNPAQKNGRAQIVLVAAALILTIIFRKDWQRGILWILGATLVLSPVLHPWYVTWILPFACWRRQYAWFILSLSATVALLVWEDGPFWRAWELTWPLRLCVSLPPLLWLFANRAAARTSLTPDEPAHA
jgi:alpha-1,6-mannosyltransferase